MSFSLRSFGEPQEQRVPGGSNSSAEWENQASAPSRLNHSMTPRSARTSSNNFPQASQKNTTMGTPQKRCREMHQSGRSASIWRIRSWPHAGVQFTRGTSARARSRKDVEGAFDDSSALSMRMNHCSVARKITGLWQRQQSG